MGVTLQQRGDERVVAVDGDLASPAILVQLRATLNAVAYSDSTPIVVDLVAAEGQSPGVARVLKRAGFVLAHRGVPFRVIDCGFIRF